MQHTTINGAQIAYELHGQGEPVVLLHSGFLADAFVPLLEEPVLAERYQLITYHRRGYGESGPASGPMSMAEMAADCRALLDHLGVSRAHLVGHSFGATIALQLARDAPERVHSLVLMEPPLPGAPADPVTMEYFMAALGESFQRYASGDTAGAVDRCLTGAFQPGYRDVLDRALPPGAFERAVAAADAVFGVELPALQGWAFTPEVAARIRQPVLSVVHEDRLCTGFQQMHDVLLAWLPQAEGVVIPDATHLLQIQNPRGAAEGLAGFLAHHPLPVPA